MCAPPEHAVRSCVFSAARRAPCGARPRQRQRRPGPRPPAGGYPSVAGREEEISDRAQGYSFLLGTCPKAARGPKSWRPDRPGEDEERGECCRVGKPQVPKSRGPKRAHGERHEGARGGSLTGERGFSLSPKSYRSLRTVQASSLEATRRLDNQRGQPGSRQAIAWVVGTRIH